LGKHTIFAVVALTLVWVILVENISVGSVLTGVGVSVVTLFFMHKFLPFKEVSNINFYKLVTFPFYLVGQIYVAGFEIIRIIIKGSAVDIVSIRTKIESEALRVVLVDSITLMPGSILLDLDGDKVTMLWMRDEKESPDPAAAEAYIERKLEKRLLKAQKVGE